MIDPDRPGPLDLWLIGGPFHGRHYRGRWCARIIAGPVLGYDPEGRQRCTVHVYDTGTGFHRRTVTW
ncbi:MAG: hypothetical protein GY795_24590 [Desulfobacterales bacterium]|nr:hypothetical protein [Desulfobacterales bacterium]